MTALTHAEARAVFGSIVDADLAAKRARLAARMAAARRVLAEGHREAAQRRAAFWANVELDAEWRREQAKGARG